MSHLTMATILKCKTSVALSAVPVPGGLASTQLPRETWPRSSHALLALSPTPGCQQAPSCPRVCTPGNHVAWAVLCAWLLSLSVRASRVTPAPGRVRQGSVPLYERCSTVWIDRDLFARLSVAGHWAAVHSRSCHLSVRKLKCAARGSKGASCRGAGG